jgi:hypothetical protein
MRTLRLWKVSGVRMSMHGFGFILGVLVGDDVGPRFSECVLKRCIEDVAGLVTPALMDEFAKEKIAVARIAEQMTDHRYLGRDFALHFL